MAKPKMGVFASGSNDGGGSGLKVMLENIMSGVFDANITGVVSNYEFGGVRDVAIKFGVPFHLFESPFTAERYLHFVKLTGAEWFACSGWLQLVRGFDQGLDSSRWFNIHPGLLPEFGGKGMYGHHVHEATMTAFNAEPRKVHLSAVTMHFMNSVFDDGAIFYQEPVAILEGDTADDLGTRVNEREHGRQSDISELVIHQEIRLETDSSVSVPEWYAGKPYCPKYLRN